MYAGTYVCMYVCMHVCMYVCVKRARMSHHVLNPECNVVKCDGECR